MEDAPMQDAQQIARELIQRHGAQAEAVAKERAEQLQLLSAAKVDAAQGYYFGAPQ